MLREREGEKGRRQWRKEFRDVTGPLSGWPQVEKSRTRPPHSMEMHKGTAGVFVRPGVSFSLPAPQSIAVGTM